MKLSRLLSLAGILLTLAVAPGAVHYDRLCKPACYNPPRVLSQRREDDRTCQAVVRDFGFCTPSLVRYYNAYAPWVRRHPSFDGWTRKLPSLMEYGLY